MDFPKMTYRESDMETWEGRQRILRKGIRKCDQHISRLQDDILHGDVSADKLNALIEAAELRGEAKAMLEQSEDLQEVFDEAE